MRISVDRDKCCGFGTCMVLAPELFDLRDEDNLAFALVDEVDQPHADAARKAAAECPTEAISVLE